MKHLFALLFLIVIAPKISFSQQVKKPAPIKYIFDPKADAKNDLQQAIEKAKISHKNVLVIVGGDWNSWSLTAYSYLTDSLHCEKNVEMALINFSVANKNAELLTQLDCPKNLGYPIFMVLDENGKKLHAQDTDAFKADKKHYNPLSLLVFLNHWTNLSANR